MKNRKYQLFCMLLSASTLMTSPAVPVLASQGTTNVEIQQEAEDDGEDEEWDNDALFEGFITSLFYPASGDVSFFSSDSTEKSTLNAVEKQMYNDLKTQIEKVAKGTNTSTEFAINVAKYGEAFHFTADNNSTLDKDSIKAKLNAVVDMSKVWHALLADMPYELYWHDKSQGGMSSGYSYSLSDGSKSAKITELTIKLAVNAKYAEKTEEGQYDPYLMSTDTTNTVQRATAAAAKAQAIVNENAGLTDYDKLKAYMSKICELNTYNTSAAENMSTNNTTEGVDPWQLIYVFDENPSTNVVCEGYSKAFAYLCELTNFTSDKVACYVVTGRMSGGTGAGGHMWNIVTMEDGKNYLVDVTNCDADTIGAPDKLFLVGLPGTAATSYTFTTGSQNVTYTYDQDIQELYGTGADSFLTLSDQNYSKKELENLSTEQIKSMVIIPGETSYTGQEVSATLSNSVTGAGTGTIYYKKEGSTEDTTEAPRDAGTYKVYLSVSAGTNYNSVDKTEVGLIRIKQAEITSSLFDAITDQTFTGSELKPKVSSQTLKEDTDYTIESYSNNTNIASANQTSGPYVTVKGEGNYTGSVNLPFNIVKSAINGTVTISGTAECGQQLTASATITSAGAGAKSYQWYRKDNDTSEYSVISGATLEDYLLTAEDYGKTLKVEITAVNTTGKLEKETGTVKEGNCPEENVPKNPTVNDIADTFSFDGKDGVTYEYSLDNGETWKDIQTTSGKASIDVGDVETSIGKIQVRAKAVTGYKASDVISNATAYTEKENLSNATITLSESSFTYDGTEKKPSVTVTCGGKKVETFAYDVKITSSNTGTDSNGASDGVNAGTVTLTVTAKENTNYKGTKTVTYRIEPAEPVASDVKCSTENLISTTSPSDVKLTGTVTCGGKTVEGKIELIAAALTAGTSNYTWKFTPNDQRNYKSKTGTIPLTVKENKVKSLTYTGTLSKTNYVYGDQLNLDGLTFTAEHEDSTKVELSNSDLSYEKSLSVGQTEVEVSYTKDGTTVKTNVTGIVVSAKNISDSTVSSINAQTYIGSEIKPTVIVTDGNQKLTEGTDYEVTYSNNINAASADVAAAPTVTITGKGNYTGAIQKKFAITKAKQEELNIVKVQSKVYGDQAFTMQTNGGTGEGAVTFSVLQGSDIVDISGNMVTIKHAGTVKIQAVKAGGNNYEDAIATYEFGISPRTVNVKWSDTSEFTYDGKEHRITATVDNPVGTDSVKLTMEGCTGTNAGTFTAKVTGVDGNSDYTIEGATNLTKKWTINAADIADAEITLGDALTYTGKEQTQTISGVTLNGQNVTYTVSGDKKTNAGSYELTITGTGNYKGTAKKSYTVAKSGASITLGNLAQTEGSVSAVTAVISPASADAAATVEYLVTKDGKETWTTELPKTAGSYQVRAFLDAAKAGKNLNGYNSFDEAKAAGKSVENTLVISKASSGGGNSGSSGSGSGGWGGSSSGSGSSGNSGSGTQKPGTETPGTGTETPGTGTGSETGKTETVTNPDGSTTTVSNETKEDGTTVRKEETVKEDGSSKTAVTETKTDGTQKTTTTVADSEGRITSVTEKTTMQTVGKAKVVTVIVKKDGEGSVTSAKAAVSLTGRRGKVSIDGSTVTAIKNAAGTDAEILMTVKDSKGKTLYKMTADSEDLKAGSSLKVFKYSAKKGYVMVNAKTYKTSKNGSVSVSLKDKTTYRLENTKTAAKIEKQILASVKPAKTSVSMKAGKSIKAALAESFNLDNAKNISYSTSNYKVVKVSNNGTVKALKRGTASVNVKVVLKNGKTKTVKVKVTVK